ncbi:kinase-like protein, partial [Rhizophagus irregularis]
LMGGIQREQGIILGIQIIIILLLIGQGIILILLMLLSKFGKSGNTIIDDFILEKELRWIPNNKFKNVEYFNEGGFGTIYKAIWLKNNGDEEVILKCHKNLNENLNEFLKEWEYHISVLSSSDIINIYGFTEDPNTSNMIHENNLIHCDFHDGNILNHNDKNKDKIYISDLGLCQPVKSFLKKYDIYGYDIYGVMPFMAPEVLRGKSYTPASDMYSFSMIMWELTSGVPPFSDRAHDIQLSLSICKGERPEIIENTPQCYVDLMKRCWNEGPLKRPSASE